MHFFSPIKLKTNNNCCEGSSRKYNEPVFQTHFSAGVAELVDAVDSKSTAFGCAGSSPAFGTIRTSRDINGRLFLRLKSNVYKAFPHFFSLPKYTKVNPHQVPAVGICVGISRFDNSLYQRKVINHGSY